MSPGFKFNEWEMKGVPIRVEVGPRDVQNNKLIFSRRDQNEKHEISVDNAAEVFHHNLEEIQQNLFNQAQEFQSNNTYTVDTYSEFKSIVEQGGFIKCGWDGEEETETLIKQETKATIRCIPFNQNTEKLKCIYSNRPAKYEVIFARAY